MRNRQVGQESGQGEPRGAQGGGLAAQKTQVLNQPPAGTENTKMMKLLFATGSNLTMNDQNFASQLLRYYAFARHPLGRWCLILHVQQQRLRAQWLANGTDLVKRACDILVSLAFLLL